MTRTVGLRAWTGADRGRRADLVPGALVIWFVRNTSPRVPPWGGCGGREDRAEILHGWPDLPTPPSSSAPPRCWCYDRLAVCPRGKPGFCRCHHPRRQAVLAAWRPTSSGVARTWRRASFCWSCLSAGYALQFDQSGRSVGRRRTPSDDDVREKPYNRRLSPLPPLWRAAGLRGGGRGQGEP